MTSQPADSEVDALLTEIIAGMGAGTPFGGGAVGARWGAKRLKNEVATARVDVGPQQVDAAVARLADLLRSAPQQDGPTVTLAGVLGSGFGNMNPALVRVEVTPAGHIRIAAHAKEGLIKQRTAQKAVNTLTEALG